MKINTFDIDGVIYFGENHTGVRPHPIDIIVTGRSFQQEEETEKMLEKFEIRNRVMYNPLERNDPKYSRKASGQHKAQTLKMLQDHHDYQIGFHFEDDPIQIEEIKKVLPNLNIVHLVRESEEHVKY